MPTPHSGGGLRFDQVASIALRRYMRPVARGIIALGPRLGWSVLEGNQAHMADDANVGNHLTPTRPCLSFQ